jgi:hypothetical protein
MQIECFKPEELIPGISVSGVLPDETVTAEASWCIAILVYCDDSGKEKLLSRDDGKRLSAVPQEQAGAFNGDGRLFRDHMGAGKTASPPDGSWDPGQGAL